MVSTKYILVVSFLLIVLFANVYVDSCVAGNNCLQTSLPQQLRVAIDGPNTITISWRTDIAYNVSDISNGPRVQYSTNSSLENGTILDGTSSTYTKYGPTSWLHDVILPVNSSTRYYYRILASGCINSSETHSFLSQRATRDSESINITFLSNLVFTINDTYNQFSDATVQALTNMSHNTAFFLHIGGFGFADAVEYLLLNISKTYEFVWNRFQNATEKITAENIYMTVPGSHEVTCAFENDCVCTRNFDRTITNQYRNFSTYLHRFSMPGGDSNMTYKNMWYSFDYGRAHIVVINTETDFPGAPSGPDTSLNAGNFAPNGTQLAWLDADLKDARNRSCDVPWIIVAGHRHWYGTVNTNPFLPAELCPSCGDAFAEIIFNNTVDFYFSGHFDWYERLYPVDRNGESLGNNYTDPQGPIYVTVGPGGHPSGGTAGYDRLSNVTANIVPKYGFTQLQIIDSSRAELYFYESPSLEVGDHQTVIRNHSCNETCSD